MSPLNEQDAQFARQQLAQACDKIEHLLHGLLDSKTRIAEQVHTIRKLGKSLRGGFSLFLLGKNAAIEIQAIGRMLAGPRDAVSHFSTWHKLAWTEASAAAIDGLLDQQTHSAARRPPPASIAWCIARVAIARQQLLDLPPENLCAQLNHGLHKLRNKVSTRTHNLNLHSEHNFHDARKALKAYHGALSFLPEGRIPLNPKTAELPELLGDENDLSTLSHWLNAHGFTEKLVPTLWLKLQQTRHNLRQSIILEIALIDSPDTP